MRGADLVALWLITDPPSISKEFIVGGLKREARIYPSSKPAAEAGAPLVFAFLGQFVSVKELASLSNDDWSIKDLSLRVVARASRWRRANPTGKFSVPPDDAANLA